MSTVVRMTTAKAGGTDESVEQELYEVRRKIYPRAVTGVFARWRVALVLLTQIVFYGTPWLQWTGRQAVLFDLMERKFYVFGLVLWPQDFIYLTALLLISALSLFLFTTVAGRLWCGYSCPQTVYTEMFLWIERRIEGDRPAQMKLDQAPMSLRKLSRKAGKHAVWIALALWTGFTFVGYFTPIKTLASEVAHFGTGPWETFWVFFYSFATYGNAGFMREQVCKYMCPYARFQSVMFDSDTLVVTYDKARGEARGARSRSADHRALGLGDCVDCGICVQVCPTGIDIRNGLQYECIGCGSCIDGCNQVMARMGYPKGLIRNTTENALAGKYPEGRFLEHMVRPRVLIYAALLLAVVTVFLTSLWMRVPVQMNVMRDRAALERETDDGNVENVYRLQLINMADQRRRFKLEVSGIEGLRIEHDPSPVEIAPLSAQVVTVDVAANPERLHLRSTPIKFRFTAVDDPAVSVVSKSAFLAHLKD